MLHAEWVLAEIAVQRQRIVRAPVRERGDAQVARCTDAELDHVELARAILRPNLADGWPSRHARGVHKPQVLIALFGPDEAVNLYAMSRSHHSPVFSHDRAESSKHHECLLMTNHRPARMLRAKAGFRC